MDALKCTENKVCQRTAKNTESKGRTLVVDGISNCEDAENGGQHWCSGGVLSVEEPGFETSKAGSRSRAFRQLRVEVDEGSQAFSRASGLNRINVISF